MLDRSSTLQKNIMSLRSRHDLLAASNATSRIITNQKSKMLNISPTAAVIMTTKNSRTSLDYRQIVSTR